MVNKFNYSGSPEFGEINNTQSWINAIPTVYGIQNKVEKDKLANLYTQLGQELKKEK